MGFWLHLSIILISFVSFVFYFYNNYNNIIKYKTISSYSSENLIGQIFLLVLSILMSISINFYWWFYLSYVYYLREKINKKYYYNLDIFFILVFSTFSTIGLLMIGIYPVSSYNKINQYNTTEDFYQVSNKIHLSGVFIFVLLSFLIEILDVFFIKRNIYSKLCYVDRHLLILIYIFINFIFSCVFLWMYFYDNKNTTFNFQTIVIEVFTIMMIIFYPLFFCHYKYNIFGGLLNDFCCTNPEKPNFSFI